MKSFSELPSFRDLRKLWKQKRVSPPSPDLELTEDSWVERGAEVICWQLCRLEYWLSESGWLRAFFRLSLILAIVLTIAGVLLLPPIAQVLAQLAHSSYWVAAIVVDLVAILTAVPPAAISLAILYLFYLGFRFWRGRRERCGEGEGYYQ